MPGPETSPVGLQGGWGAWDWVSEKGEKEGPSRVRETPGAEAEALELRFT